MNKWLTILFIVLIVTISWIATTQITRDTVLTEAQAISRVETFYNSTVESVIQQGSHYVITFATNYGIYEIAVDEKNGRFSQLHLIHRLSVENTPQPNEQPSPLIPVKQAETIALSAYAGELEETTFYAAADGGYYLIEIDAEPEDVILQIHAVTGKILSVAFEE